MINPTISLEACHPVVQHDDTQTLVEHRRHDHAPLASPKTNLRTPTQKMAVGPFARLLAQIVVPVVAVLARALPAAYAQALQNARKAGVDATEAAAAPVFGKRISRSEALQVLNLTEQEAVANPEAIQKVRSNRERGFYFFSWKLTTASVGPRLWCKPFRTSHPCNFLTTHPHSNKSNTNDILLPMTSARVGVSICNPRSIGPMKS